MNILTFTTLYPNSVKPSFAVFVENRLRHLLGSFPVKSVVVSPVPWIPFVGRFLNKYKGYAKIPTEEEINGIKIHHPRFLHLPVIGAWLSPVFLAACAYATIKKIQRSGHQFELIDAHYFYPDGVAAVILSKILGIPVVITARGTDINLFPEFKLPRAWIKWAACHTDHVITVSMALRQRLIDLGADGKKITVLRNGVDLEVFSPQPDRELIRNEKSLAKVVLLSVGRLEDLKGHELIIQALTKINDAVLLVAGDGPLRKSLEKFSLEIGVANQVRFLGSVPHNELSVYYTISDMLVLASSREGWPNVLLESMACGTPVVATNVGGSPEVVTSNEAGIIAKERSPEGLVEAINELLDNNPPRDATRAYAENFSWDATSAGQYKLFKQLTQSI